MKTKLLLTAVTAAIIAGTAPAHAWWGGWSGFAQGFSNIANGSYYGSQRDRSRTIGSSRPMSFAGASRDRSSGNAHRSTSTQPTQRDRSRR